MRIHNRFGIDESMWVRITSDGKGTEEPIKFWPHMHRNIPREPGVYQVHLTPCEDNWNSPAIYDVNCPCDVYVDGQGLMWNASDDSMVATSQRSFTTRLEQYFLDLERIKRGQDPYGGQVKVVDLSVSEFEDTHPKYVRLSGQDGSSEEFVKLTQFVTYKFSRKANFMYYLEVSYKPEPNSGKVYLIPVNEEWIYRIRNDLFLEGSTAPLLFDKFRSAGEDDPKFMNSNDFALKRPNEIVLFNTIKKNIPDDYSVYARLSGIGGGSEEYRLLKKYDSSTWTRNPGTHYINLQRSLEYTHENDNFVVNNLNNYLICLNGQHIKTLDGRFAPHVTQFRSALSPDAEFNYSKNEANCKQGINNIPLQNNSNKSLNVRIRTDLGSDDFYELPKKFVYSWYRKTGKKYMMEIQDMKDKSSFRFYVTTNDYYIINEDHTLTTKEGTVVPQTDDPYGDEKIIPHKPQIKITNDCKENIWVRLKAKTRGSEELFNIAPGCSEVWLREPYEYHAQVIMTNHRKFNYLVYSPCSYIFRYRDDWKLYKMFDDELNNWFANETTHEVFPKSEVEEIEEDIEAMKKREKENDKKRQKLVDDEIRKQNKEAGISNEDEEEEENKNNNKNEDPINKIIINNFQINSDAHYENDGETPYFKDKIPNLISGQFVDEDFPPESRILNSLDANNSQITPNFDHSKRRNIDSYHVCFKRPSEIFGSNYQLFKDRIEYDDAAQGQIGDCYLISVISSLAQRPELIQSLFKTKSKNSQGFYEIYYYENKVRKIMFVDDHFPYYKLADKYMFAQPNGAEIWVLLLEKVFAKYEGGYSNIIGGHPEDALKFFTGAETRYLDDWKLAWEIIILAFKNDSILVASSHSPPNGGSDSDASANGIHYGHAYSILEAKEYKRDGKTIKLIKLRNPWASSEWKGPYSDYSSDWTPELKEYFGTEGVFGENGTFFMSYEDFSKEFRCVAVGYLK